MVNLPSVYPPEYAELQQTNQKKAGQGPQEKNFMVQGPPQNNFLTQGPCYASTDLMEQPFNKTSVSDIKNGKVGIHFSEKYANCVWTLG